ncbi:MAG TPA: sugar ABC transporter substrate-binding protein [Actinophytocola sp.]|uniref:sugar ABC transporter substrate-binding protein n=1 Tax=Actinophytocola sp. TaxID=1872138 RepID=UPI002DC00629|nr:sugar ABC transporter substrate-binding protein [Actinophytocola sp.]HEU5472064.1 sugar ABC transporter substrate-binding protein [Actinophytocola sp.]
MARLGRDPSFLPLTLSTVHSFGDAGRTSPAVRAGADAVFRRAREANAAAAECWAALLGGCDAPGTRALPGRLRDLTEATAMFAGRRWWQGDGSQHRYRIARAQRRIEEAIGEQDGAEFAEAFVGYDQAVATALVRAYNRHTRLESPAR